ncbi:DUF192 domain-containing protein [Ectopseudomonas mendocina]|uniref:DUF192 domain-containing protein n=1 Tax=Ectopseudomonas mendocina TaxID=300 RepID=A0ABZ2REZ0_ECTME
MAHKLYRPDGTYVPLELTLADSLLSRLKGLLGRAGLNPAEGIWISPCNSVHCFFMRFAIDVVYLDSNHQIVAIRPNLAPWRISLCWKAKSVIELAAGECQRLGITPGDKIKCAS